MIKKLYEFLELQNSYNYSEVDNKFDSSKFSGNFKEFLFKADDGERYWVLLHYYGKPDGILKDITWSNEKDIGKFDKIDNLTSNTININILFKIINTVFKIVFDFMDKENIKIAEIGSRNKNKFKLYKKSISEEDNFEIIKEYIEKETYYIRFKKIK